MKPPKVPATNMTMPGGDAEVHPQRQHDGTEDPVVLTLLAVEQRPDPPAPRAGPSPPVVLLPRHAVSLSARVLHGVPPECLVVGGLP